MSSPSRMNDLQEAHCPSLQPCMSMTPCSAAARRMVWSSLTSISMPTGSKRMTCFSVMPPRGLRWIRQVIGKVSLETEPGSKQGGRRGRPGNREPGCPLRSAALALRRSRTAGRALLDVASVERIPLLSRHLVEQHVRAEDLGHPPQVIQGPHLLGIQVQVRLADDGLAVVTD